ncbi:MAG: class I SAM-dependent methyltransferase [Desulfatitalea sp.]|nr:class I SAM-dependent methyltransferase [Desulfatitalea sp.]
MNLKTKISVKIKRDGIPGALSSSLRHMAHWLDNRQKKPDQKANKDEEFLNWVYFAVPGMLTPENVEAMRYAIANMPIGRPVVEIGSFCGLSTTVLSYLLSKRLGATLFFTCDKWEFEGQQTGKPLCDSLPVTHDDYQAYVKETFLRTMHTFAPNALPHTIECISDDFFRRWFANETVLDVFGREVKMGGSIGFCYIDGNHTYKYAKRDFENVDKVLVPGGLILFDDSADGSPWEVNILTREIAAENKYDLISKRPNYLFRKR